MLNLVSIKGSSEGDCLRLRSVSYLICREDDLKMTNLSSVRHFPGFLADFPYAGQGANS